MFYYQNHLTSPHPKLSNLSLAETQGILIQKLSFAAVDSSLPSGVVQLSTLGSISCIGRFLIR